jgi:uncharacterized membrane protein
MKLLINYDIIEKIAEAKGRYVLERKMKNNLKLPIVSCSTSMALNVFFGLPMEVLLPNMVIVNGIIYASMVGLNMIIYKHFGELEILKAFFELNLLSSAFQKLKVETDLEMLLEAEEYEKHHRLILNNNRIPAILQSKYILVPTVKKEVYILQEHIIGSKQYILSVGSPKRALKPAFV